ncbi:MAG TPA: selenium metabolism-associated LysR family transcriptional regulator [Desulfopila sp.]|nr:selenium metabolism-associated LysR family transcriptional regulator [Desulfopila sp.]
MFSSDLKQVYDRRLLIETRHLKIFTAVYTNKSFTRAAEQLYTSQPTISEHIRNLESRLDCRLFDRLGRTIIPTFEADLLYPRALAILDDLKKLENELTAVGKNVAGTLTIAASTIPSAYILPRLAADFAALHPKISFEIRTSDSAQVVEAMLGNEILLGFVGAASETEKLQYHPFMKDQLVLAASSRKKINQRITSRSLLELPFILREKGSGTRKSLEWFLHQKDIYLDQLNTCAVLGSSTAVTEAVKNNLGVSILSSHAVNDAVDHGQIQIIDIIGLEMSRDFYAVTSKKRSLPHHFQVFLKYVLQASEPRPE